MPASQTSHRELDLTQARTIPEILGTTASVYISHAWLFLLLAAIVVIPYEAVVALLTHTAVLGQKTTATRGTIVVLAAAQFLIVQPLVAAAQVQAVALVGDGERPRLTEIFRLAASSLLTVIAAEIIAGICIFAGFFAFLVPGIILLIRLYVVAQVAAIETVNWPTALRRSFQLTNRNWWRILGLILIGGLINLTIEEIGGALVGSGDGAGQIIVAIICAMLTLSFTALLNAVLYFDLRARQHR